MSSTVTITEALERGLALHRAGQLDEAAGIYRQIVAADPGNAVALRLLGLVRLRQGDKPAAVDLLGRAVAGHAGYVEAHRDLGTALAELGRAAEAAASFGRALALEPDNVATLVAAGVALARGDDWAGAAERLQRAVALAPGNAEAQRSLGNVLARLGRHEAAATAFAAATTLAPQSWDAQRGLAYALAELGRHAAAVESYRRAVALKPDLAEIHNNLGNSLALLERFEAAEASYRRALALDPGFAPGHNNLANVLGKRGRFEEAVGSYRQALACDPLYGDACHNLGVALLALDRFAEAAASYRDAIRLKPGRAETHNNLGQALEPLGRWTEAVAEYETAIGLRADFPLAHLNASLARLLTGDLAAGFREYEWRWQDEKAAPLRDSFSGPHWLGAEDIAGRTLLLYQEQGLGDAIQFARYVPLLRARGAETVLELDPALCPLFAGDAAFGPVLPRGAARPPFELHCPLMSLPLACGTTLATIPAAVPYLRADPARVARWRAALGAAGPRRIGLAWSGNPAHQKDRFRSLPFAALAPLLALPGIRFVSLQKEIRPEDAAAVAAAPGLMRLGERADLADAAAIVAQLDLVITVDSAFAHLAGALGTPVWVLLSTVPDWRWLLEREDSPWYPTARLFRQERLGDWAAPIERMRASLAEPVPARLAAIAARALVLHGEGRLEAAAGLYRAVLAERPDEVRLRSNLGAALRALGRREEAVECYRAALAADPTLAGAHSNLGNVLTELGRHAEAVDSLRQALALAPGEAVALHNLGRAQDGLADHAAAAESYRRAVALRPRYVEAWLNLGNALSRLERGEEALSAYRRALELRPDYAEAHAALGALMTVLARPGEALACYDAALALRPDWTAARWDRSLARLLTGDLAGGFADYECRWLEPERADEIARLDRPFWHGEFNLAGRTILLHQEQGLGDAIQFARYAPLVEAQGGRVVLELDAALAPLFAGRPGFGTVIARGGARPAFDLHCPLMSLPLAFGTTLDTVPAAIPYVEAAADRVAARWPPFGEGLRVGLAWSGNPGHRDDRRRSLAFAALAPLLALPGIRFVSLQNEIRPEDAAAVAAAPGLMRLGERADLAEAAAIIARLDLVITVDSAFAHLAGAMGRPVWVLLGAVPDWRWLRDRPDSPWYPTARLFRQPRPGDWAPPLEQVRQALSAMAAPPGPALQAAMARALALHQAGDAATAAELYRSILAERPHEVPLRANLGAALNALGRPAEAAECYRRAIEREPGFAAAHNNLGNALLALGRPAEAAASLRRAVALAPGAAEAQANLGRALERLGEPAAALACHDRALALDPGDAALHYNRGNALAALDRDAEAAEAYRRALALEPGHGQAMNNLGKVLTELDRHEEALAAFRRAGALRPADAEPRVNAAMSLLGLGDFAAGWTEYEWRLRLPAAGRRDWPGRRWTGAEPLDGRTILLTAEQGLGDSIQFLRYAPLLQARGAAVVLHLPAPLRALAGARFGRVLQQDEPLPPVDFHCPLPSLPLAFGTRPDSIPAAPYLAADPERVAAWRQDFAGTTGLRVGLVWSGSPTHPNDRRRSLPFTVMNALTGRQSAVFVSLQREVRDRDAAAVARSSGLVRLGERAADFADTAALIAQLDLVVSVDTAVAHLAGAMGRPVWILLPYAAEWRWRLAPATTPWYPTARLIRQPAPGDWSAVVEAVAAGLAALPR